MSEENMEATSEFEEIRAAYEASGELTDEQVDVVADAAIDILKSILACFGENNCSIDEYDGDEGELILDVNGGDLAILIGRHGVTLDSLQVIFASMLTKRIGFHYPIVVDIEGYKSRRRDKVQSMARNTAAKARKTGRAVKMSPMNAYERRLVHLALRGDDSITTHSEGVDPERYVVITPVKSE
jgi:spoIIIJ-associated protein